MLNADNSRLFRPLLLQLFLLLPRFGMEHVLDGLGAAEEEPRREEDKGEIEAAESEEDAVVPPLLGIVDVEASRVFVPVPVLAEFANAVHPRLDVTSSLGDELLRV